MEPLRSILLAGLGAVSYSQDKLKGAIRTLVDRGELTREQGEKVISEWVERGKDEHDALSGRLSTEMQKVLGKLSIITREEFDKLVARVEELERKPDR
ncbi:MAG: phasin family protein [Planctomycetota bacterium]